MIPSAPAERDALLAADPASLMREAARLRDIGHPRVHTYSRKVFLPLTRLCRNVCHYCTFAQPPRGARAYMTIDEIVEIAEDGRRQGCHEALFTIGDKPELRYRAARDELARLGHRSTLSYLAAACAAVIERTGLLPHVNAGVMDGEALAILREVSVSQGLMLETTSERLGARGGPHHGSPDKHPAARLETIRLAGERAIPFSTGILIGIGETRAERLDALVALRALHRRHGHIQEIIVQNFRAKPDTRMARAPEPDLDELLWSIAAARLVFGPDMAIQAPPNLSPAVLPRLIAAGIDDWGGVSPVTADHVNPEAPWPLVERLRADTAATGRVLVERLAVHPSHARDVARWQSLAMAPHLLRRMDAAGLARTDAWTAGGATPLPVSVATRRPSPDPRLAAMVARAELGETLAEADVATLLLARAVDADLVHAAADRVRRRMVGDTVSYVVTRNINYTNICLHACGFCAFSKGRGQTSLRGRPYDLDLAEVERRAGEAWERGATEVCMQGGIHPGYTGETYLALLRAVRRAAPGLHIHAFSPLEVAHGASTLGMTVSDYLAALREAGLGSLPGTAAEILDDEVRAILCPDKLDTARWLAVIEAAHDVGLRTTATMMFGHVDRPEHWARHLLRLRAVQQRTGGFTEFVPLPFVAEEAPLYRAGRARRGPTAREAILVHAVARLALHPLVPNIQASWVKLGADGVRAALRAGVNDLGGTLMNESITRAAGAVHGEEMSPAALEAIIRSVGRVPRQRTTLYADAAPDRVRRARGAEALSPIVLTPPRKPAVAAAA